ncbi:glycerol-3-phosphate 1-O-acyltransferase PlsY [Persephonella sp. KM09-Lau-8]|uniref:glycerol-3-phosphate 1-O-acyltransferase PlsY n=1 Tax=Persephonella sp. KM09-Lau-8 TaxID=1158345 RepID=UPI000497F21F|nr:glycerol-3-phosphate 1-O-acyltransferase PlsY [Persephonella sp. KM09-Lau-8]
MAVSMKIAYLIFTYLIGSIPFGYVVGKLFGKDITKEGSGNIGATNVTRTIGKKAGILVLILDLLKGFIPVFFAKDYFHFEPKFIGLVAVMAVVGHCFSVFMKFKGGKGVATGFGVLIALSVKVALITFILWLGVFLATGYVSLASIIATSFSWVMLGIIEQNLYYTWAALIISLIIVMKHSSNIERLMKGTENRFIYK